MLQLRTAVREAGGQSGPKSDMLSLRRRPAGCVSCL